MLRWSVIFLVVSIIAGLLGFTIVAGVAATIAKIFFAVFIVLLLIFIIRGIAGYRRL